MKEKQAAVDVAEAQQRGEENKDLPLRVANEILKDLRRETRPSKGKRLGKGWDAKQDKG